MRSLEQPLYSRYLIDEWNILQESIRRRTCWLRKVCTIKRICIVQILYTALQSGRHLNFTRCIRVVTKDPASLLLRT